MASECSYAPCLQCGSALAWCRGSRGGRHYDRGSFFAQFIRICIWLPLIYKDRIAPLKNAPFSTLWARKRYRVVQRFRQYLRATNCYKLSESVFGGGRHVGGFSSRRCLTRPPSGRGPVFWHVT